MSASVVVGYALAADSNRDSLVAIGVALLGAVVAVITTMMSNASANRRHRMDLRYQRKGSGLVGFLFVVIAILTAGLVVVATRSNNTAEVASAGPTPPSTAATAVTAVATTTTTAEVAAPACAAFTVQIAAIPKASEVIPEFEAQAQLLAQSLPVLRELHSDAGDACQAPKYTQYYFGPFADGDAALAACFGIGQVLHDNPTQFTTFKNGDTISYPYYRVVDGISVTNPDGSPFLCDPALQTG